MLVYGEFLIERGCYFGKCQCRLVVRTRVLHARDRGFDPLLWYRSPVCHGITLQPMLCFDWQKIPNKLYLKQLRACACSFIVNQMIKREYNIGKCQCRLVVRTRASHARDRGFDPLLWYRKRVTDLRQCHITLPWACYKFNLEAANKIGRIRTTSVSVV